ncbi:MAG: 4-hydroxy-tetrahydrodipicolinate reductase [Spirochaetes bacterium]|nr:MAG: 4-hydroxy-tetrahydrodipicolinate reductase [Spirochaetota bacterium]
MKIGVCGAGGRMGRAITRIAHERGHVVLAAFEHPASPLLGADAGALAGLSPTGTVVETVSARALARVDGILDFTAPAATVETVEAASALGKCAVIGTTGLSADQMARIERCAAGAPLLVSPNMSLGVNVLFKLTQIAARVLNDGFDIEVFEAHHRNKKDAPSGTARRLIDIVKSSAQPLGEAKEMYDRVGSQGARSNDEIGIQVLRGGDIVGEHTVFFVGEGERLELTHRATNRDILARGAVLAFEYLSDKKPGMYSMFDVLGLSW